MDDAVEHLTAARKLVRQGWIRYAHAVNNEGKYVISDSTEAVAWCTAGAMFATGSGHNVLQIFREANNVPFIAHWNDAPERTQEEVIAAFDKAIELARHE